MRETDRDSIDFGNMKISALFGKIFFPTLLGMIFNAVLTVTDGIIVGQGIGSDALAAVNIVSPIFLITSGIGLMFGVGSSVVVAIHLAKENFKAANINVTQAFVASIILILAITVLGVVFCPQIVRFFGCTDNLMNYATEYFYYFVPSCVFLMLACIGMFLIRLDGSPRYAMFCSVFSAIINGVLDYIFVFPFGWGLKGAALATSIGVGIGGSMVLFYMLYRSKTLKFYRLKLTRTSLYLSMRNIGYMLKIGSSALLGELAVAMLLFVGNYAFLADLGEDGVAAYSVACYLFPLVFMVGNSVAQTSQPIISYNYGANNTERVKSALKMSILVALSCGILVTVLFNVFNEQIISLFLKEGTNPFNIAKLGIPYFSAGFIICALNMVLIEYFQSIEQSTYATVFTIFRGFILLSAAFIILPKYLGTPGIWLAVPIAELITFLTIIMIFYLKKVYINVKQSDDETTKTNIDIE